MEMYVCLVTLGIGSLVLYMFCLKLRAQIKAHSKHIERLKTKVDDYYTSKLGIEAQFENHKIYTNRENHALTLRIQQLSNTICVLEYALEGDKYGVLGEMLSEFPWEKERVKTPLDASNLGYFCVGSVNDVQVWIKRNESQ